MLVFLAMNSIELRYSQKELYSIVLSIADGSADSKALLSWIVDHQV